MTSSSTEYNTSMNEIGPLETDEWLEEGDNSCKKRLRYHSKQ